MQAHQCSWGTMYANFMHGLWRTLLSVEYAGKSS